MKHLFPILSLAAGLLCLHSGAASAEELPRVNASEEKAIRELVGKKATVLGRVIATKELKTGLTFLDFEGGKFTAIVWKDDYAKFEGGNPAQLYGKKVIEVTGTVFVYKAKNAKADAPGKLEIKLTSPDQVKIAKDTPAPPPAAGAPGEKTDDEPKKTPGEKIPGETKEPQSPPKEENPVPPDSKPGRVDPKKFFK